MKKLIVCALLMALSPLSLAANITHSHRADYNFSSGLTLSRFFYKDATGATSYTLEPGVLEAYFDYIPWRFLAFSLRAGAGISDDKLTESNSALKAKVSHTYGLYLKPQYQVDAVLMYALIGGSSTEFKLSTNDTEEKDTLNGFSYGLGLGFSDWKNTILSLEIKRMHEKDDIRLDTFTLGFGAYF